MKKRAGKFLIAFHIIIVVLFLAVCLVPFLNAGSFWFIAVVGLSFPLLLVLNFLFLITWAIKKSRWIFLSLISLLLGWQQVSVLLGFHFFKDNNITNAIPGTIRVFSWNVSSWDENNKDAKGGVSYRPRMLDTIKMQQADVLCLQEFFEPRTSTYCDKNIIVLEDMGYKYHYFYPVSITGGGEFSFGMAIFSKFPILDSGKVSFGKTPHSEGLIYADIKVHEQVFRIFSTHLESFKMGKDSYFGVPEDDVVKQARHMVGSLRSAYKYRSEQARLVRQAIGKSPHPSIVCGNLGDIPNSYSYFTVRGDMQDAFLKAGSGLGRTFRFLSPTLRIDYLLADRKFTIRQYRSPKLFFTDHYPLVVDIEYETFH